MFSDLLLQIIIFFLPTQLGLHFWPDFARAAGIKVDYLSPTLYITDIFLLLYLFSNWRLLITWLNKHFQSSAIFISFILINVCFSSSPANSFFWWLRWLIYLLFFLCLRLKKVSWPQIKIPLISISFIALFLQFLQFFKQASIGGIFYWLGERIYSFSTPGLGKLTVFGQDILRSPSFFSHPNSLAGYFLIIIFLLFFYKSAWYLKFLFSLGLIFTFSKGALLAFLLVIIFRFPPLILITSSLVISVCQLFIPFSLLSWSFITDRLFLIDYTRQLFLAHPFFGVGLGSFVFSLGQILPGSFLYSAKLQPVHNIFLLLISELGIVGMSLLAFLFSKKRSAFLRTSVIGLLALISITGTFDHYWLTLPQNKLILLLSLALVL